MEGIKMTTMERWIWNAFRTFIFLIALPFGVGAGIIPGFVLGKILSIIWIPEEWGRNFGIGLSAIIFALYIVHRMVPSNEELDRL